MFITVFGDVHGNLIALEKLFEIEKDKTDLFVCHGDVVNYGPWSNECVEFLNNEPNVKLLKGNHESFFLHGQYDGVHEVAQSFFQFCYPKFKKSLLNILREYEENYQVEDFIIQHTIGNQYIFADTDIDNLILNSNYIIGHSHQQFFRQVGIHKLYNTGSICQNRSLLNLSCYLKYDTISGNVELKSFIHDISKVIKEMEIQNYPKICIDYYKSKKLM